MLSEFFLEVSGNVKVITGLDRLLSILPLVSVAGVPYQQNG